MNQTVHSVPKRGKVRPKYRYSNLKKTTKTFIFTKV